MRLGHGFKDGKEQFQFVALGPEEESILADLREVLVNDMHKIEIQIDKRLDMWIILTEKEEDEIMEDVEDEEG